MISAPSGKYAGGRILFICQSIRYVQVVKIPFLFTAHFVTCIHRKRVIFTYFTHLKRDITNGLQR
nr:MAG TPA: hypothetical protein [Caudoviricetes sp.]DAQ93810.1 MAG TPA: hypothetical protein [Bacteriophage sp.]